MREEVGGDQVDPDLGPVTRPDLAVEAEDFLAAPEGANSAMQPAGMHVVGAEQVAHTAVLAVGRAQPLRPLLWRPAVSWVGISWIGPISSKQPTDPSGGHWR